MSSLVKWLQLKKKVWLQDDIMYIDDAIFYTTASLQRHKMAADHQFGSYMQSLLMDHQHQACVLQFLLLSSSEHRHLKFLLTFSEQPGYFSLMHLRGLFDYFHFARCLPNITRPIWHVQRAAGWTGVLMSLSAEVFLFSHFVARTADTHFYFWNILHEYDFVLGYYFYNTGLYQLLRLSLKEHGVILLKTLKIRFLISTILMRQ